MGGISIISKCKSRHTKFQPSESEWRCPRCDADSSSFFIESSADDSDDECNGLHKKDVVECTVCRREWSGQAVSVAIMRKVGVAIDACEHCNGTGFIKRKVELKYGHE